MTLYMFSLVKSFSAMLCVRKTVYPVMGGKVNVMTVVVIPSVVDQYGINKEMAKAQ
jgi:hypothetical protein